MDIEQLEQYLLSKKGAVKQYHKDFDADRFLVSDKMFAMQGREKAGKPIITLKLEPPHGESLRREHDDIIPGYYMNKVHWNSLYLGGRVPDEILMRMIDESYDIIFGELTKRKQREVLELP